MQSYQKVAGVAIERYDGHVAQYLGDGLMVYFGWPRAHEDDAARAIHAALEITGAVKGVSAPEPLEVRVGVATGQVVVGETGAGDASVPKLAAGETPNLAARLQSLAGADEIVIGETTRRLAAGAFAYDDLGAQTLKGIAEPIAAFKVAGAGRAEGRFEAAHGARLTPFVGRDSEIALLAERWAQATGGEGQVVLLEGEPGIGKSRISGMFRERVATAPHVRLLYQCSPFHANSAFQPITQQLERAAGFDGVDDDERHLTAGSTSWRH